MRELRRVLAAFVVAGAAASGSAAELITTDGISHQCEILSVGEDGVLARGALKSGAVVEVKVPAARIDPWCFYALRDAAIGTDAQARVRFAVWCVENDLFAQAKVQMRRAAEADPSLIEDLVEGKYPEIREKIASRLLLAARTDMNSGRLDAARQTLEIVLVRLSDTAAGGKARDVLCELEEKSLAVEAKRSADAHAKLDELSQKAAENRKKLMAPVVEHTAAARALVVKALTEDDVGKALDLLEKALGQDEKAIQKLNAIAKVHGTDDELLAEVLVRRPATVRHMVQVHLRRADLYIWRNSLPDAKHEIDAARALDPENPAIDAAMERLLAADADDDPLEGRWLRDRRAGGTRFGP